MSTDTELEDRLARLAARRAATPPAAKSTRREPHGAVSAVETIAPKSSARWRGWARTAAAVACSLGIFVAATSFAISRYRVASAGSTPADPRGMVEIPAARYTLGVLSPRRGEPIPRSMLVDAYAIDRDAVSSAAVAQYLERHAGFPKPSRLAVGGARSKQPVVGLSRSAAEAYCRAQHKRLPTESEWEIAARGYDARTFPWGNAAGGRHTIDVSPFGVKGLVTGVPEWVGTPYEPVAAGRAVVRGRRPGRPRGTTSATMRRIVEIGDASVERGTGFRCAADAVATSFIADFADPASGWPEVSDERRSFAYRAPSGYSVSVHRRTTAVRVLAGLDSTNANVSATVRSEARTARQTFRYGLALRASARGMYSFVLEPSRSQWELLRIRGSKATVLAHGIPAEFGGAAVDDRLRAEMRGAQFELFVNDQLVAKVVDRVFDRGDVGLYLESMDAPSATMTVDTFTVALPQF